MCLQCRKVIHEGERIPARLDPILPGGRHRQFRHLRAEQLALVGRAEAYIDPLSLPETDRRVHLRAGQHEPDRPRDFTRGKGSEPAMRPERPLTAETAADVARDHPDILTWQAEHLGDAAAVV